MAAVEIPTSQVGINTSPRSTRDRENTGQGILVTSHRHPLPGPALSLPSTSVSLCPHINNQDVLGPSVSPQLCSTDTVWRALHMNRALKDPVLSGAPQWALFGVCACSLLFGGCQCEVSRSILSPFKVLILVHGQSLSIAAQPTITVTSSRGTCSSRSCGWLGFTYTHARSCMWLLESPRYPQSRYMPSSQAKVLAWGTLVPLQVASHHPES